MTKRKKKKAGAARSPGKRAEPAAKAKKTRAAKKVAKLKKKKLAAEEKARKRALAKKKARQKARVRARRRKRALKALKKAFKVIGAAFAAAALFIFLFYVRDIEVTGNAHETDAEILSSVNAGEGLRDISLIFKLLESRSHADEDSFVERIDIRLKTPWRVEAAVTEKTLSGYAVGSGARWYFDSKGKVRTSVPEGEEAAEAEGNALIEVKGIDAEGAAVGESLPGSQSLFSALAYIKSYMDASGWTADCIEAAGNGEIVLVDGDLRINLGSGENLELRLGEMEAILPNLDGKSGTLHLENFDGTQKRVIFEGNEALNEALAALEARGELPTA